MEEAGTPPPEDQEFEDDDGTIYKWDPKLRKFQPKRLESNGEYGMEEMTFEMDEEAIPTIQSPEEVNHHANQTHALSSFHTGLESMPSFHNSEDHPKVLVFSWPYAGNIGLLGGLIVKMDGSELLLQRATLNKPSTVYHMSQTYAASHVSLLKVKRLYLTI